MSKERRTWLHKWLANGTAVVLALLLGWMVKDLALAVYQEWNREPMASWKPQLATGKTGQDQKNSDPYQALAGFEMFGRFRPELKVVAESLPDTQLPLSLQAIFYSPDKSRSSVMLDTGSKALLVHSGEEIMPGVSLYEVRKNGITLYRKGEYERLELDRVEMEGIDIERKAQKLSNYMSTDMLAIKRRLEKQRKEYIQVN